MNIQKEHQGTIKHARLIPVGDKHWVEGNVYGHQWFGDGEYIHTSSIVDITGNIVETRNSIYTVEWASGHAPELVTSAAEIDNAIAPEQVEDSPITPSVPVNVEANAPVVPNDGRTYARILRDECGAARGTIVLVDSFQSDGSILYTDDKYCVSGIISSAGSYEFVSDVNINQENPDHELIINIAEQFVTLFDNEELRHADIEYFASAFKDALRS